MTRTTQTSRFATALAVSCAAALTADLRAQDAATLDTRVAQAEALARTGDAPAAREAAAEAWRAAQALGDEARATPAVQAAFGRLADAALAAHDLRLAAQVQEAILAYRERTLPQGHDDLQAARMNLGASLAQLGQLPRARELLEGALAVRTATLPDDDPLLLLARENAAGVLYQCGEVERARALYEKVFTVRAATLPADDPNLLLARQNYGAILAALDRDDEAREMLLPVLEIRTRTLPPDHPDLLRVRQNLLNVSARDDVVSSRELLVDLLARLTRSLPDDHRDLQITRAQLARTMVRLGDLRGARELQEKVIEVWSRTLAEDDPDLMRARGDLVRTLQELGDEVPALALVQRIRAVRLQTLRPTDPAMLDVLLSIGCSVLALGDAEQARAIFDHVCEARAKQALPADHTLTVARANLAAAQFQLGELQAARAIQEEVLREFLASNHADPDDLRHARANLALTCRAQGEFERAAALTLDLALAARRGVDAGVAAPREVASFATASKSVISYLLVLRERCAPATRADLEAAALLTSQTLNRAEARAVRMRTVARRRDPDRAARLEAALRRAADELAQVARAPAEERVERLTRGFLEKERVERELARLARGGAAAERASPTIADLAARLPERCAAVAIVKHQPWDPQPGKPVNAHEPYALSAFVLDRAGRLAIEALGPARASEARLDAVRAAVTSRSRGERPDGADELTAALADLGRTLLDPIVAALPKGTDTIVLSCDDWLELLPIEALPLASGALVGDTVRVQLVASLLDLLDDAPAVSGDAPALVAFGGIDYDAAAAAPSAPLGYACAPGVAVELRGSGTIRFPKLLDTGREVRRIADAFATRFEGGAVDARYGGEATKTALAELAPRATYLHLATHGFFAPESVKSTLDAGAERLARFDFGYADRVSGLSPLVLTGLALAGANLPADAVGRRTGIATAEELLTLDLSRCVLATLSACDTSLGVQRAGQGFASLRSALHGAGARYVLATLWKVSDEAALDLMSDFYERMWKLDEEPYAALWAAKAAARTRGVPFRDWAGWVLSGR